MRFGGACGPCEGTTSLFNSHVYINCCFVYSTQGNRLVVVTASSRGTTGHLAIKLELIDGSLKDTGRTFEYRTDPHVTDITPRNHLIV